MSRTTTTDDSSTEHRVASVDEIVVEADNDEGRGSDSQNHCNDGCEAADEEGLGNLFG